MRQGLTPALEERIRAADPAYRHILEAEVEVRSDIRQTRDQFEAADGVVLTGDDFAAGNLLDAAAETAVVTIANGPPLNHRFLFHYRVSITPIVPGAGVNDHEVILALESNADAAGWVERATVRYFVRRKTGESATTQLWRHEAQEILAPGLDNNDQLRIRVKSATGPMGWAFAVHGFNAATDLDPIDNDQNIQGVTYHTGRALTFHDDGNVELADSIQVKIEQTNSDQFTTDLDGPPQFDGASPFLAARVVWGKDDPADMPIDRIVAHLHPKQDAGQPKTVAFWVCQLWALLSEHGTVGLPSNLNVVCKLVPLAAPIRVPAIGTAAEDVTFSWIRADLLGGSIYERPRPKRIVPKGIPGIEHQGSPTTFVFIWAVTESGAPATNVGWGRHTGTTVVTNGSRNLRTVQLTRIGDGGYNVEAPASLATPARACHRIRIETGSFVGGERLQFSGAGTNRINLGAVPTDDVVFWGIAEIPAGTSAIFEVLKDGGTIATDADWVTYTHGQKSSELVNVSKRQHYELRCRLISSAGGDASSAVVAIGAAELLRVPLSEVAQIQRVRWAFDPITKVAEITEAEIVAIRDGERDFEDAMTSLLAAYLPRQIRFRAYVGALDLPRSQWLHQDDFFLEDQVPSAEQITVVAVSALALLRVPGKLPRYDTTAKQRSVLRYANKTLKQVYDDLLGVQLVDLVTPRERGPGVTDNATLVSKTIDNGDSKAELEAIVRLAGMALTSSQGRIKAVDVRNSTRVVAVFTAEEIQPLNVGPGYRQRVPEYFVKFAYNDTDGEFDGEVLGSAGVLLGRAHVDPPGELEDTVARWIPADQADGGSSLAERVAAEHVASFGAGLLVWSFRSTVAYPELEVGDVVVMNTDWFVARDPNAARALKGMLYAVGVICEVGDIRGTQFSVWIRSYADIFGSTELVGRVGFGPDVAIDVFWQGDRLFLVYYGSNSVASIRYAVSQVSPFVDASAGTIVNGQSDEVDLGSFPAFQAIYIAVVPFSLINGVGSTGPTARIRTKRIVAQLLSLNASQAGTSPTVTVTFAATIDDNTREIQWLMRVHPTDWPTDDGTENGPITQTTYFQQRKGALATLFGRSSAGAAIVSGTDFIVTGRSTGDRVAVIAIPIGHDGRPGPRMTLAHTVTASPGPSILPVSYVVDSMGSSCSAFRTYDFTHTPNGAVDDTMEVRIFARVDGGARRLIATNLSPSSTPTTVNVPIEAYETGSFPDGVRTVDLEFELRSSIGALLQSGSISPQDFFNGILCPL